jgi:putative sigma-54 modulation protein
MERFKSKVYRSERGRRASRREQTKVMGVEESAPPGGEAEGTSVVRYKTYPIKPMPLEGAIHQMELLCHDFFFFMNSDADSYDVLYRRRDGDYGLSSPSTYNHYSWLLSWFGLLPLPRLRKG